MKFINKVKEPTSFTDWKKRNPNAKFKDLIGKEKKDIRNSLLKEQHSLCCYCECRISNNYADESESFHIEHFKPKDKDKFPQLQLEYSNLHASCIKNKSNDSDIHCGHRKGNEYSDSLISPLEEDCASHFVYELDGTIVYTDHRGKETIRILHLDSNLLNISRKKLIDYFLFDVEENNLENEISCHLDESLSTFGEFYTMIEYLNKHQLL